MLGIWMGYIRTAYDLTGHDPAMQWSPKLMREVIKAYGDIYKEHLALGDLVSCTEWLN